MTRKRSTAESERHADDKSQSLDDGNRLPDDNNQSHDSGNQLPDDNNQSADAGNELPDDNNRTADDDNWDADDLKSLPDAVGTPICPVGTPLDAVGTAIASWSAVGSAAPHRFWGRGVRVGRWGSSGVCPAHESGVTAAALQDAAAQFGGAASSFVIRISSFR